MDPRIAAELRASALRVDEAINRLPWWRRLVLALLWRLPL